MRGQALKLAVALIVLAISGQSVAAEAVPAGTARTPSLEPGLGEAKVSVGHAIGAYGEISGGADNWLVSGGIGFFFS